jgi:hypothetical protein
MLYDPKWEVKTDPFTLDSLIAWLEKQPADGTYCYDSNGCCILAQYFTAMGFKNVAIGSVKFYHGLLPRAPLPRANEEFPVEFNDIAQSATRTFPFKKWGMNRHTFGAALARARHLAAT